jgi:hypothetical protein
MPAVHGRDTFPILVGGGFRGEQGLHGVAQVRLVPLDREHVFPPALQDQRGGVPLGVERIQGNHVPKQA